MRLAGSNGANRAARTTQDTGQGVKNRRRPARDERCDGIGKVLAEVDRPVGAAAAAGGAA